MNQEHAGRREHEDKSAVKSFSWHLVLLTAIAAGFVMMAVIAWSPWSSNDDAGSPAIATPVQAGTATP
jgi:hypothetical protein